MPIRGTVTDMSTVDGGSPGQDLPTPLAHTVAALSKEIRDLRRSARVRAVIEQAKGILVERHGIGLDEAFARLRSTSQEHNVRVVEVAATIVGVAIPDVGEDAAAVGEQIVREQLPVSEATSGTWRELRQQDDVRAGVVTAMMDAVAGSTGHGDEAAQLLLEMLEPFGPAAATMYSASADSSLRFLGQIGVPGDLISPWRSIPPSTDIPYVYSVVHNTSLFFGDRAARVAEFPSLALARGAGHEAIATVPVVDQGSAIGVVGLMWREKQEFDELRQHAITKAVQRVAPLLMRNSLAADPELEWLNTLLRLHLDPWLLMEAVPSSDRVVRDFIVQDASVTAAAETWIGRRLLEIWPALAEDGTVDSLSSLVRAGGSWSTRVAGSAGAPWGQGQCQVRAVRLGQRVVLVWRSSRD